jgi:hypothetical protein
MAQDPGWRVKGERLARCWVALITAVCAACVTAEPLSVAALRAAVAEQGKTEPYSHDLAADLAWIQAMPVLERLATDIVQLKARFIAVGGDRWSVPGVPSHLYCLISPASLRPIPIREPPATALEQALNAACWRSTMRRNTAGNAARTVSRCRRCGAGSASSRPGWCPPGTAPGNAGQDLPRRRRCGSSAPRSAGLHRHDASGWCPRR